MDTPARTRRSWIDAFARDFDSQVTHGLKCEAMIVGVGGSVLARVTRAVVEFTETSLAISTTFAV